MRRAAARVALVAILGLLLILPAGPASATRDDLGRGAKLVKIRMKDANRNRFVPATITVSAGTRVRWINKGSQDHTTTSNTGLWDQRLDPGDRFTRRFRRTGTFRFHCSIHPEMTGTVTVT